VRVGMLFPGQGSQAVGMGADLVETFPEARAVFQRADEVLGFELAALCFRGPIDTLTETRNAQPALLVHSVAVLRVLEARGVAPSVVAGHSLGEYSALVAAGALQFEDAVRIVRRRGELMFASGLEQPGTMAAVIGAAPEAVEAACAAARAHGVCDVANYNAPDQVVLSGSVAAIEDAMARLEGHGAKMVKRLNVSGAFHSELMQSAAASLAEFLDGIAVRDAQVPVVANVTARPVTEAALLRELLKRQIASPVRWDESVRAVRALDPGPLLEVGAGSVLKGLARRIDREAVCTAIGDRAGLDAFLKTLPSASGGR